MPGARDGKPVFSFGLGDTALHFASLGGPVVMDSVDVISSCHRLELLPDWKTDSVVLFNGRQY